MRRTRSLGAGPGFPRTITLTDESGRALAEACTRANVERVRLGMRPLTMAQCARALFMSRSLQQSLLDAMLLRNSDSKNKLQQAIRAALLRDEIVLKAARRQQG